MFRLLLISFVPIFLPAACFKLRYCKNFCHKSVTMPWVKLLTVGFLLAIATLFFLTSPEKAPPEAQYTPPKYKNGVLIPANLVMKK